MWYLFYRIQVLLLPHVGIAPTACRYRSYRMSVACLPHAGKQNTLLLNPSPLGYAAFEVKRRKNISTSQHLNF